MSTTELPEGWELAASAFSWTPEVIAARRPATEIALGILDVAPAIELEPGQLWRSFPKVSAEEASGLGTEIARRGGRVTIVGASLDDWRSRDVRRTDDERLAFLLPQLETAARVGALGVRLPIGQAGALLERIMPHLVELGIVLFEEVQGQQVPQSPAVATALEAIAALDDPHVRVLLDSSMLMPALPVTYLELLERSGIPSALCARLRDAWVDPDTHRAVVGVLQEGGVPPPARTLYMNMLVRFGRSDVAAIAPMLPLLGAVHLKLWDLDDEGGRVSEPLRALGPALVAAGFRGPLCSEWGGHEWLDADPAAVTRAHLELAGRALVGT